MCQIITAPAGKKINLENLDKAQEHNGDGYGVAWYENDEVNTYKTMDYDTFRGIVAALTAHTKIVHLRYNTVGKTTLENCHPFTVPNGVMFHNGTISSLKPIGKMIKGKWTLPTISDSKELGNLLQDCWYESVIDIEPMLTHIIGTTINKLAFLEDDGTITIVNEHLGIEDDGIWYSNDYHLKDDGWCRAGCYTKKKGASNVPVKELPIKDKKKKPEVFTKVFVYGTLKRGYSNYNRILTESKFLGKATTAFKWTMIGKDRPFPYVVELDDAKGHNVMGEVFLVNTTTLGQLNTLEGISYNHYKQQATGIVYENGKEDTVMMYIAGREPNGYKEDEYLVEWTSQDAS